MATAIALFAIPYVKGRNWKRAFLIILLAFTFHRSAIIFFCYFLFQIDITPLVGGVVMIVKFGRVDMDRIKDGYKKPVVEKNT